MKKARFGLWRIMSLRNNYLSLVIVAVLFSTTVFSQTVDTTKILQNIEATGYNWKGGKFRSYLVIPSDTPKLKVADSGAVSYKGGSQWLWTGKLWKKSSGGGTTIYQSGDSSYFTYRNENGGIDTVIFVGSGGLDTTSLSNRINNNYSNIDSVPGQNAFQIIRPNGQRDTVSLSSFGGSGGNDALKLSIANYIIGEALAGTLNGINAIFTLVNTPLVNKEIIYIDGIRQLRGTDYTISTNTITFTTAPATGSFLITDYLK